MVFYYKKGNAFTSTKAKKAKSTKKSNKPSQNIKAVVKKEMSRALEKKTAQLNISGLQLLNISNDNIAFENTNIFCIGPYGSAGIGPIVSQGVGQGERIGNSINIKKAIVKGVFYPDTEAEGGPRLVDVNVYILRARTANNLNDVYQTINTKMFQDGNTDVPLTGVLMDNVLPINKDAVILYKHVIRKVGFQQVTSLVSGTGAVTLPNNDYKVNNHFTIDCTKYVNKAQKFNDASDFPTNELTWLMFSPVPASNTLSGSGADTVKVSFSISLEYTDA